jgi:hypothetical protein
MKIRPVGAELLHVEERIDGWTDRHDEANSLVTQFKFDVALTVHSR